MNSHEIKLVQTSFHFVLAIREQAAELFYNRLFVIDPSTRQLFEGKDMRAQGGKLMAAIATVVRSLDQPQKVMDDLRNLALRHSTYGVEARHYASVGTALLWTLKEGLGTGFTQEHEAAWANAYALICGAMIPVAEAA
jgi:hemoglobin-like flavoprotein